MSHAKNIASLLAGLLMTGGFLYVGARRLALKHAPSSLVASACDGAASPPHTGQATPFDLTTPSSLSSQEAPVECAPPRLAAAEVPGVFAEALALQKLGQNDEALVALERVLEANPRHLGALVESAMIYQMDRHDPRQALPFYERAYALKPSSNALLSELVGLYEETGAMRLGVDKLKAIAEANPGQANLAYAIGKILASNKLGSEALPYLETAVSEESYQTAYTDLGNAYAQVGDAAKARLSFEAAVREEQDLLRQGKYQGHEALGRTNLMTAYLDYATELFNQGEKDQAKDVVLNKVLGASMLPFEQLDDAF